MIGPAASDPKRAAAYAEGYLTGCLWAEAVLRSGRGYADAEADELRADALHEVGVERARALGIARGYRHTLARWYAGELTSEML